MKRRGAISLLLMSSAATLISVATGGQAAVDRLTLAVLPCTDIEATFKKFYPLTEYLKTRTGTSVRLVVPATLEELLAALDHSQVDLVIQDPHTWLASARYLDRGTLTATTGPGGAASQTGVVVVRRDSGIEHLDDLKGRPVLFGPRTSTPKWVAARMLFSRAGIDVDRDIRTRHGGCCEDIAFSVIVRSADAGVVCDHFIGMHPQRQRELGIDMTLLRVVARTSPFPNRVLAARRGAPASPVARVLDALRALSNDRPDHRTILASLELSSFSPVTQGERAALERLAPPGAPGSR